MAASMCKVNAVILAAGRSKRMGANKLLLPLGGKSLLEHFLDNFPFSSFQQVVAVYAEERVAGILGKYPLKPCFNANPEKGKSLSIRLGTAETSPCDGILYSVADQPLLSRETVTALLGAFHLYPNSIVVPYSSGKPANPVIIPAALVPELEKLQADEGGSRVIRQHSRLVCRVETGDADEFTDIDTEQEYRALVETWAQTS